MGNLQHDLSQPPDSVTVERLIAADAAKIWAVWSSADGMQRWLRLCLFQPRRGGRVLLDTSTTGDDRIVVWGRVQEFEAPRALAFGWRVLHESGAVWPAETLLRLSLVEAGRGCLVRLAHSGFAALGAAAERNYNIYHHCWAETPFMERLDAQCAEEPAA